MKPDNQNRTFSVYAAHRPEKARFSHGLLHPSHDGPAGSAFRAADKDDPAIPALHRRIAFSRG
jgi:hypothetical protein